MQSDQRNGPADVARSYAGTGHVSAWACGACGKPQFAMVGRRLRRVRGVRSWVCPQCAKVGKA
jgi:rubredoxin